ncbi:MAG: alpha/beta hydrolase [Pseudomonadota bacterium]
MGALTWLLIFALAIFIAAALALLGAAARARADGEAAEASCPPLGAFLTIETPGGPIPLHYVERGPTEGAEAGARAPILMIHGLGGTLRHFTATILDDLARDHRAIAVDRPGAGYSGRAPHGSAHLEDQAAALGRLLDGLGALRPLVIGHSLGGAVALALALQRPVAGLLLLSPATHPFRNKPPTPDQTVDSPFARRLIARTYGPRVTAQSRPQILSIIFGPQSPPHDYATRAGGALTIRPGQLEAAMEDGALLRPDLAAQSAEYGEIDAPITILFGDADRLLDPGDHIPPLRAKAPQTEARILQGIGHMTPFAARDAVLEAARALTAKV